MQEPSQLIERILRPEGLNTQDPARINKLCDIIRETSFEIHKFLRSLGYLRASRIEHGLLINSGAQKLQIKKYILNKET